MGEALGAQQREIVGRAVVFCVLTVGCAHEAADRQIKTRRAILPLVVAIGDEGRDAVGHLIVPEDMSDNAVDGGIPPPALLIGYAAGIAEAREDQAVRNMPDFILVAREPSERSDRARDEEEAIVVPRPQRLDMA